MPDTSWALVRDEGRPGDSIASRLVAHAGTGHATSTTDERALLERWGAFVATCTAHAAFAATADNVRLLDDELGVAADLRAGIEPLDAEATAARLCWHLARFLVVHGAAGDPDRRVDELAGRLGGTAGLSFSDAALARALVHEATQQAAVDSLDAALLTEQYARESAWTMPTALAAGAIDPAVQPTALLAAWTAVASARRDRDRAEADAVGHAAARALAADLGAVLERDEWIRARLRNVKSTKPARVLIAARKKALGRA
jgi:hypothetical protein